MSVSRTSVQRAAEVHGLRALLAIRAEIISGVI
jgi:hypothetical protein